LIHMSADPEINQDRRQEIAATLTQTLEKKNIAPLKWNFILKLYEEKMDGLHRRFQVVMHLMSNTQHLGLIITSEYLHLLRSVVAVIGTYARLYESLPKYLIPCDIIKSVALFPATFILDRMVVGRNLLYHNLARTLPIPKILKPNTDSLLSSPAFVLDHTQLPVVNPSQRLLQTTINESGIVNNGQQASRLTA